MADDISKTALEVQIDAEAKQLSEVPKVPISRFFGTHARCHICGQLFPAQSLRSYDTHVRGNAQRVACPSCHPQRSIHGR